MKNKNIRFNVMAIVLVTILCIAITPITFQNDTFYTIKIGEYILENGITMQDPFSWHEGLSYTFPHWLYDVIIYLIYSIGGVAGIYISTIILCIALGIILYLTNVKLTKNNLTSFLITLGVLFLLRDYIAARAQLVTFILFTLTVYYIERFLETRNKRYVFGLIIIPILIANLHLAVFPFYFVLYLPYIAEYIISIISQNEPNKFDKKINKINKKILKEQNEKEIEKLNNMIIDLEEKKQRIIEVKKKAKENPYKIIITKNKNIKYLIIVMIVCLFTGLITPLGATPYTYLYSTVMGNTTQNISEHLPLVLAQNKYFMGVIFIFLLILMFTDTKIKLRDLFMLGGLLFLSFYTRRQISIFVIICSFILNKLLNSLFEKYDPEGCIKVEEQMVTIRGIVTTIFIVLCVCITLYKPKMNDKFVNENAYPVDASQYILENLDLENIRLYNEYNFGSYLLYRGIPVFIDSRADLYAPEFNKGKDIFTDFLNLSGLNINKIEEKLDEYGITHLIMNSKAKLRVFVNEKEEEYNLLYDDNKFCIYERNVIGETKDEI